MKTPRLCYKLSKGVGKKEAQPLTPDSTPIPSCQLVAAKQRRKQGSGDLRFDPDTALTLGKVAQLTPVTACPCYARNIHERSVPFHNVQNLLNNNKFTSLALCPKICIPRHLGKGKHKFFIPILFTNILAPHFT